MRRVQDAVGRPRQAYQQKDRRPQKWRKAEGQRARPRRKRLRLVRTACARQQVQTTQRAGENAAGEPTGSQGCAKDAQAEMDKAASLSPALGRQQTQEEHVKGQDRERGRKPPDGLKENGGNAEQDHSDEGVEWMSQLTAGKDVEQCQRDQYRERALQ